MNEIIKQASVADGLFDNSLAIGLIGLAITVVGLAVLACLILYIVRAARGHLLNKRRLKECVAQIESASSDRCKYDKEYARKLQEKKMQEEGLGGANAFVAVGGHAPLNTSHRLAMPNSDFQPITEVQAMGVNDGIDTLSSNAGADGYNADLSRGAVDEQIMHKIREDGIIEMESPEENTVDPYAGMSGEEIKTDMETQIHSMEGTVNEMNEMLDRDSLDETRPADEPLLQAEPSRAANDNAASDENRVQPEERAEDSTRAVEESPASLPREENQASDNTNQAVASEASPSAAESTPQESLAEGAPASSGQQATTPERESQLQTEPRPRPELQDDEIDIKALLRTDPSIEDRNK